MLIKRLIIQLNNIFKKLDNMSIFTFNKCDEDPTKICPHKSNIKVLDPGVLTCSSENLIKCCKSKKQIEALKRLTDKLKI